MINRYCGLTDNEVKEKQKEYGLNLIENKKKKTLFKIIISQFNDASVYLLVIAGVLSILLKEFIDFFIFFTVLLINTIIGSVQE